MKLLSADHSQNGSLPEAEPVSLSVENGVLLLVLDDGTELAFDLEEFVLALEQERGSEVEAA